MAWYGWFSNFYDRSLEDLYAPHRASLFGMVSGAPASVLDVACGTGQNFPFLAERRAAGAKVWGVDLSAGMLARARQRAEQASWSDFHLLEADIRTFGSMINTNAPASSAERPEPPASFDWVICTLGLTVVPDWEAVFAAAWSKLAPGGQFLIMDVWAEERGLQSWIVEKMAQADLSRQVYLPLQSVSTEFQLQWLEAKPSTFGGKLFAATGEKAPIPSRS